MGFRFRKSIKIAPGVKLNFNKKSTGISFGGKGVHYTINSKGNKTASVGIPGTGISYSESYGGKKKTNSEYSDINYSAEKGDNKMEKKNKKKGCLPIAIIGFVLVCIIGALGGNSDDIAETTTEITTVIENVITTAYTTKPEIITTIPVTTYLTTTTELSTTSEPTTDQMKTTTEKSTTTTSTTKKATTTQKSTTTTQKPTTTKKATTVNKSPENGAMVWIPESGKKYHSNSSCSNMKNPSKISLSQAEKLEYTACKKCY